MKLKIERIVDCYSFTIFVMPKLALFINNYMQLYTNYNDTAHISDIN